MTVKLRRVGNSITLTVPKDIKTASDEYIVKNVGDTIVYTPVLKPFNPYASKEWREHDFQADMMHDPELQAPKPVGREVIN